MTAKDTTLTTFTTRVRQMILKYQEVRKENSELYAMVDERDKEIAELKMPDLNAASLEAATDMIKGTARSMGVTVVE